MKSVCGGWRGRRSKSVETIVFRRLLGMKPGLVGLWSFDDGTGARLSPGRAPW